MFRCARQLILGVIVVIAACSDDSHPSLRPTATPVAAPAVSNPEVLVGGQSVRGLVIEGTGDPSLFRVRVHAPGGLDSIERVMLQYSQPGPNRHGGPMMGGFRGTVLCYDDGTHGDDIAGDGIYHFMDPDEQVGCHGIGAPSGDYHYQFWCEDIYGQTSNVAAVTVTRQ